MPTAFKLIASPVILIFHRVIDNRIQIIPDRKNTCQNHIFYFKTDAYIFKTGACYCVDCSVHVPKLTKAKLWNAVKYYTQNASWTYVYMLYRTTCETGEFFCYK